MLRTQIQIEEDQIKWLRIRAKERGVSVSQLIREGVEFFVNLKTGFLKIKKRKHWRRSGVMRQVFPTYLKSMMIIWLKLLKQGKDMTFEKAFTFDKHFTEHGFEVLNEHALR